MAGKNKKVEYGLLIAPLGITDSETSLTKKTFFATLEAQYPSEQGWEVWDTNSIPSGNGVIVTYHVRKVSE